MKIGLHLAKLLTKVWVPVFIGPPCIWMQMVTRGFILRLLDGSCYDNHVLGRNRKTGIPHVHYTVAFHKGWEDRNVDERVNTMDDPSISYKNLVNFGLLIPEFTTYESLSSTAEFRGKFPLLHRLPDDQSSATG